MATRTAWVVLLAAALALAGCTNKDDAAGDDNTTPGDGPNGGGRNLTAPKDVNVTDSGAIQGPFSQSWDIVVENVAFRDAMVHFALTGAQAGAPPTARVNLQLTDPDGGVVKSATLGLGGDGDSVDWALTPADLPAAGTYTLAATAGSDAPLPSIGFANYELMAMVTY